MSRKRIQKTEVDDQKMFSVREAAEKTKYSRGYISRLARDGKIIAENVDGQWLINLTSLNRYGDDSKMENEIRSKHLSNERKQERQLTAYVQDRYDLYLKQSNNFTARALISTVAILLCGISLGLAGYALQTWHPNSAVSQPALASVSNQKNEEKKEPVSEVAEESFGKTEKDNTLNDDMSYQLIWFNADGSPSATPGGIVRLDQQADGSYVMVQEGGVDGVVTTPVVVVPEL